MIAAKTSSAITIREVHVVGQRPIGAGSGMSIKPATGSLGIALSMSCSGRSTSSAPNIHLRQQAEQVVQLLDGFLRGAQRQNRNPVFVGPGENAAQTGLAHFQDVLSYADVADINRDMQFA